MEWMRPPWPWEATPPQGCGQAALQPSCCRMWGRRRPRSCRPPVTQLPESTVSPHYQLITVYKVLPGRALRAFRGVGWAVQHRKQKALGMPLVGAVFSLLGAASVFPVCRGHRTEQGTCTGTEERQWVTNPSREPMGNKGRRGAKAGLRGSIQGTRGGTRAPLRYVGGQQGGPRGRSRLDQGSLS